MLSHADCVIRYHSQIDSPTTCRRFLASTGCGRWRIEKSGVPWHLGEAYVQQWTQIGWFDDDDDDLTMIDHQTGQENKYVYVWFSLARSLLLQNESVTEILYSARKDAMSWKVNGWWETECCSTVSISVACCIYNTAWS